MQKSPLSLYIPRIALVEDDECLAMLLRYNFEAAGCAVEWFARGDSALELLLRDPPDIVVLDWNVPGLAGIEVLRQLRRTPHTKSVPVLMLTGRTDPECRVDATSMGVDVFVTKPFTLTELIAKLRHLIEMQNSGWANQPEQALHRVL